MKVTKKQWVNSEECVLISVQSDKRVVFGIANLGSAPCTRSLSLSGIDYNKILSGSCFESIILITLNSQGFNFN